MKNFMNALAVVGAIVEIILLFILEFYLDGMWGVIVLLAIEVVVVVLIRPVLILDHKVHQILQKIKEENNMR
jgi:hypothetical protein